MSEMRSTALVPVKRSLVPSGKGNKSSNEIDLVTEETYINNREQVRKYLPDILGKILARIWIDPEFHNMFSHDPEGTLLRNGVHLPETMSIQFQKEDTNRPRIVVYEQAKGSKFKVRIFYLQLIMMAGR